jgi:hypothetical protein
MQVRDQIAWSLPSLIPGLLARPSTPFSAGSRERPPSPNFSQLYIVEPSSGFNKGLRSTSLNPFEALNEENESSDFLKKISKKLEEGWTF